MFCKRNGVEIWWLGCISITCLPTMPAYTHALHCSLLKIGWRTTLWLIILHKKEFNCSVEVKYKHTFELMFGGLSVTQSIMHTGWLMLHSFWVCLHKIYPRVFFEKSFACTRRAKRDWNYMYRVHASLHAIFTQVQIKLYRICEKPMCTHI